MFEKDERTVAVKCPCGCGTVSIVRVASDGRLIEIRRQTRDNS
jgi:hypothetical protein